jgi:hypothetical protein
MGFLFSNPIISIAHKFSTRKQPNFAKVSSKHLDILLVWGQHFHKNKGRTWSG